MFLVAIWSQFFAPYLDIHSYFPFDHDVENPIIDFFSLSDFLVFKEINLTKIGFDILIVKRKILYFLKKLLQQRIFCIHFAHWTYAHFQNGIFFFQKILLIEILESIRWHLQLTFYEQKCNPVKGHLFSIIA